MTWQRQKIKEKLIEFTVERKDLWPTFNNIIFLGHLNQESASDKAYEKIETSVYPNKKSGELHGLTVSYGGGVNAYPGGIASTPQNSVQPPRRANKHYGLEEPPPRPSVWPSPVELNCVKCILHLKDFYAIIRLGFVPCR